MCCKISNAKIYEYFESLKPGPGGEYKSATEREKSFDVKFDLYRPGGGTL